MTCLCVSSPHQKQFPPIVSSTRGRGYQGIFVWSTYKAPRLKAFAKALLSLDSTGSATGGGQGHDGSLDRELPTPRGSLRQEPKTTRKGPEACDVMRGKGKGLLVWELDLGECESWEG